MQEYVAEKSSEMLLKINCFDIKSINREYIAKKSCISIFNESYLSECKARPIERLRCVGKKSVVVDLFFFHFLNNHLIMKVSN